MRPFLYLVFFFTVAGVRAQDLSAYEKHYFNAPELNLPYRLLRPAGIDTAVRYPLVIFLHGAFEKGFDNEQQLNTGGEYFLRDSVRGKYPAYILFPQCPVAGLWTDFDTKTDSLTGRVSLIFPFHKRPSEVSAVLMKLVDSLLTHVAVDRNRIYIAGLSQGGMGVLDLLARYPDIFAAGISICGAGNVSTARLFAGRSSLWLFHGDRDDVIPVNYSRSYFKKLQKLKSDVRYTEYKDVRHNSWQYAFREPDLLAWLFSKNKSK